MKKTIYRVECAKTFVGPYQSGRIRNKEWSKRSHGDKDTPHPGEDKKLSEYGEEHGWFDGNVYIGNFLFAFISIDSLYKWFTDGEIRKLKKHGFVIAAYQVPSETLIRGTHQVVYTKDNVLSRKVLEIFPARKIPHPKENYDSEQAMMYSEETSRRLLDLMTRNHPEAG
jgi:hypothetical protein